MDEKPRRGRPPKDDTKVAVTLRLPPGMVADYKSQGADWRARMTADFTEAFVETKRAKVEAELAKAMRPHLGKPVTVATKAGAAKAVSLAVAVPTLQRKAFNPQPKTGKKK